MADSGYQATILDGIARVVGGTLSTADSHFYSGAKVGDSSGITGIKGCWSTVPNALGPTPVGVVYPGPFTAQLASQGEEDNTDQVPVIIFVAPADPKTSIAILTPYRDLVPAAFRGHMSLFSAPGVLSALPLAGLPGKHLFAGTEYLSFSFTVHVERAISVIYTP